MKLNNRFLKLSSILLLSVFFVSSIQAQRTGLTLNKEALLKVELADFDQLGWSVDDLPSSASLKQHTPYAGDQGDFGTCVGWSTGYGAMTIEYARKLQITDRKLISMSAFDPYQLYNSFKSMSDYNCQDGGLFEDALESLYQNGGKKWLLPEITCGSPETFYKNDPSEYYSIKNYYRLFDYFEDQEGFVAKSDDEKINNVKLALAEDHPALIGMMLPESFQFVSGTSLWESTEADRTGEGIGGHAMCLVGYDDNKYGGAFEIMNSWGQSWGNDGFVWIKYEDFARFVAVSYYMEISDEYWPSTGCVYGDCDNGFGRYNWQNGESYEGELKNNLFDGFGIYSKLDGSSYAGQWSNGFMHGKGMSMSTNEYVTRGYWNNGSYVGTSKPSDMPDIIVVNDQVEEIPGSQEVVAGCVSGDCINGTGRYVYSDGDIYEGEFENSYRQGFGEYTYIEGDVYKGQWVSSDRQGLGYYMWPSGNEYIGYWKGNAQDGLGTKYYVGGDIEAGQWKDGSFQGGGLGFVADNEKVLSKNSLGLKLKTSDDQSKFKPSNSGTKLKTSLIRGTAPAFGIDLKFGKKN